MSSQRKIESARANGRRSRGPVTPEGKQRSSQNARKHGLLAKALLLPGESAEGFDRLVNQHLERFGEIDGVELAMIEEMCAAYWRMRRAWTLETGAMSQALTTPDPSQIPAVFRDLALLHRYETRLHAMYHRSLRSILLLRKALPLETTPTSLFDPLPDPESPELPNEPNPNSEHSPEPPSPLISSKRPSRPAPASPYLMNPEEPSSAPRSSSPLCGSAVRFPEPSI